jgi:Zn-dependent protease
VSGRDFSRAVSRVISIGASAPERTIPNLTHYLKPQSHHATLASGEIRLQPTDIAIAVFEFVLLVFSLCVHECAHAWMASRLGDQTARLQGRVTLNPMYHVDPVGTLLFPALMIIGSFYGVGGFLIGWAKPTPVITRNFKNIVRDNNLVTLAGPVSNLLLALSGFLGLVAIILFTRSLPDQNALDTSVDALGTLCDLGIQVNLALFIFNLLPIRPSMAAT